MSQNNEYFGRNTGGGGGGRERGRGEKGKRDLGTESLGGVIGLLVVLLEAISLLDNHHTGGAFGETRESKGFLGGDEGVGDS